jgi:hypothetical protein
MITAPADDAFSSKPGPPASEKCGGSATGNERPEGETVAATPSGPTTSKALLRILTSLPSRRRIPYHVFGCCGISTMVASLPA